MWSQWCRPRQGEALVGRGQYHGQGLGQQRGQDRGRGKVRRRGQDQVHGLGQGHGR